MTRAPFALARWPRTLVGDGGVSPWALPGAGPGRRSGMSHNGPKMSQVERQGCEFHACAGNVEEWRGYDSVGHERPEGASTEPVLSLPRGTA